MPEGKKGWPPYLKRSIHYHNAAPAARRAINIVSEIPENLGGIRFAVWTLTEMFTEFHEVPFAVLAFTNYLRLFAARKFHSHLA